MRKDHDLTECLRTFIQKDGRSLNELGRLSGVSAAALSRFMRHERDLTFGTAAKVCAALGLGLRPTHRKGR